MHTFPLAWGLCGASSEAFPLVLLGPSPVCCIGPDICLGALIAGRPFLFVRRDIPLRVSSDIVEAFATDKLEGLSDFCSKRERESCHELN